MTSTTKLLSAGILSLGLTALAVPAMAQTGNPNTPQGAEIQQNIAPKGNIGTSGRPYDATAPGATTGSGATMAPAPHAGSGPAANTSVPPSNLGASPSGGTPPSERQNMGPKGTIGGE
ncbi:hypothetical protein A33M_4431 [Rhodovulum sp. PH10]|uniref:hypothetical protein n=1 Tax=Rhodovulum sp. PH10 TaxID=1187851 RepID=UPI00027C2E86|nr:hypothetical protein [Rhodovulum sp. PH10]EJW10455.1 hypothetical protein A33M_4431 [Rhodovulum sp. PH10]